METEPPPVEIPITDTLDLHTFQPKEVPGLLDAYFEACIEKKIHSVLIIHGKGTGVLRARVLSILEKDARVAAIHPAPPEAGGWGATRVQLAERHCR